MIGDYTNSSDNTDLTRTIHDVNKFVIVFLFYKKTSTIVASNVLQHVLMKFNVYHLVVLDYSSEFHSVFIFLYQALNLNYNIMTKCNYKVLQLNTSTDM